MSRLRHPKTALRVGLPAMLLSVLVVTASASLLLRLGGAEPASARSSDPVAPAQATPATGQIVVRGSIVYEDRLGDSNHPAAGLKVEIWDLDEGFPTTGEKLGETTTDANGRYVSPPLSNVDRDGPTGGTAGGQDVFLKLYTESGPVKLFKTGTNQNFVWESYKIDPNGGIKQNVPDGIVGMPTLRIVQTTSNMEALWTYVNLAEAWLYMQANTEQDPGVLTAYWSPGSQDGPRYDVAERSLHFRDEDAGYQSLIIQYAAYALLHNIYDQLPPAWLPCIENPPSDPRTQASPACALVHGLAMFLPLGVAADPSFETPSVFRIDMDLAKAGTAGWQDGDRVPGRVTGSFWDLHEHDQTEDGTDRFDASFADIWDVFAAHKPDTMAEWWTGWKALGKNGCTAVGSLFQNTIDYNTPPTIQPIPDIILDEDDTAVLDLTNYVDDADCDRDDIVFTMIDAGTPEAGVLLMPTRVISVTPAANWSGDTRVIVGVSDGLLDTRLSFRVIVRPINDCVRIKSRIPDPAAAGYGMPIVLDLSGYAVDVEDPANQLRWDAEIDPPNDRLVTVAGRNTSSLTFLLDPTILTAYSVRVKLVVRDLDGCDAAQNIVLYWTDERNSPPIIDFEALKREYIAPINTTIHVDLAGIATDREDPPDRLEWFVTNKDDLSAQENRLSARSFDFVPYDGFVGSSRVELEVQDTGGARSTADITLTWKSQIDGNLPPEILRNQLKGKASALNAPICYDLTDKARDPDHSRYSLRWFIEEFDENTMFVGAQGTRNICVRPRRDFEGCVTARFVVKDPRDASDSMLVTTCWRKADLYLPLLSQKVTLRASRASATPPTPLATPLP